ncbi:glutathione S-transferase N-terminal domain-containing protein [Maricaulis sp.]|jgi:glutathione S-transferase|uniref:glutathione S-transferase N-terminal domain-containing protein n=1 Tax=Maricaulis sp. TaxID=1486257 RepID=UPI0025EBC0D5|nr:glutathione S-transferase N-terminal domain-containing protein [Maricaulis sp.]MDF1767320.1 glutathione S-transferase N-terminal domain-containing protein [Maricaulis sp.]
MKLIISTTSPYSRKCRVMVHELGLADEVEELESHPFDDDPALIQANPLGRVPCLVLDDGQAFTESALIADYLCERAGEPWPRDWTDRRLEALGNGLLDLTVARRVEMVRDEGIQSDFWIQRRERGIMRAIDEIETLIGHLDAPLAQGPLTMAVALSYMDFRYPESDWRSGRPHLAALLEAWEARPSFKATPPPADS